jgi:hypothetical protein
VSFCSGGCASHPSVVFVIDLFFFTDAMVNLYICRLSQQAGASHKCRDWLPGRQCAVSIGCVRVLAPHHSLDAAMVSNRIPSNGQLSLGTILHSFFLLSFHFPRFHWPVRGCCHAALCPYWRARRLPISPAHSPSPSTRARYVSAMGYVDIVVF